MLARFPQGRSLSACVPAGRALWFFLLLLLFCTLAKTRSDPMMKCLISNEFWITDVLNCRMNALHIYLKDRRNRNRFIHIPCFFFYRRTFWNEIRSSWRRARCIWLRRLSEECNDQLNLSLSENESEEEWEGRQGGMEKGKAFFFFILLLLLFDRTVRLWQWRRGKWGSK